MELLQTILSPLTYILKQLLELNHALLGSYGSSIVALSLIITLLMYPIANSAQTLEMKNKQRLNAMAPEIDRIKGKLRGRERFEAIGKVYKDHGYHPIKSIVSLLPLLLQFPFLLAALFLLSDYPPLAGEKFLFIPDLSQQDHLFSLPGDLVANGINVLPILLIGIALIDSQVKPASTTQSRARFLIVSAVLLILIYPFPAAVCLYWLCSNLWSLTLTLIRRTSIASP